MFLCGPLWENLPISMDNVFSDLLIKALHYVYLSYGAFFDATQGFIQDFWLGGGKSIGASMNRGNVR